MHLSLNAANNGTKHLHNFFIAPYVASAVVPMKIFYSCKTYLSRLKNICLFEFVVSVTLARAQALAPSFIFPFIE